MPFNITPFGRSRSSSPDGDSPKKKGESARSSGRSGFHFFRSRSISPSESSSDSTEGRSKKIADETLSRSQSPSELDSETRKLAFSQLSPKVRTRYNDLLSDLEVFQDLDQNVMDNPEILRAMQQKMVRVNHEIAKIEDQINWMALGGVQIEKAGGELSKAFLEIPFDNPEAPGAPEGLKEKIEGLKGKMKGFLDALSNRNPRQFSGPGREKIDLSFLGEINHTVCSDAKALKAFTEAKDQFSDILKSVFGDVFTQNLANYHGNFDATLKLAELGGYRSNTNARAVQQMSSLLIPTERAAKVSRGRPPIESGAVGKFINHWINLIPNQQAAYKTLGRCNILSMSSRGETLIPSKIVGGRGVVDNEAIEKYILDVCSQENPSEKGWIKANMYIEQLVNDGGRSYDNLLKELSSHQEIKKMSAEKAKRLPDRLQALLGRDSTWRSGVQDRTKEGMNQWLKIAFIAEEFTTLLLKNGFGRKAAEQIVGSEIIPSMAGDYNPTTMTVLSHLGQDVYGRTPMSETLDYSFDVTESGEVSISTDTSGRIMFMEEEETSSGGMNLVQNLIHYRSQGTLVRSPKSGGFISHVNIQTGDNTRTVL